MSSTTNDDPPLLKIKLTFFRCQTTHGNKGRHSRGRKRISHALDTWKLRYCCVFF